jgi:hypothetical protein
VAWVKIYGLPAIDLKEEVVMMVATLVGDPILVDELSLIKTGSVRVKINCRDPSKLRGFVRIFFNKMGYEGWFVSEKYKYKSSFLPPPQMTMMKIRVMEMEMKMSLRMKIVTENIEGNLTWITMWKELLVYKPRVAARLAEDRIG